MRNDLFVFFSNLQNCTHFLDIRHRIVVHDRDQFEKNIQNEYGNTLCHNECLAKRETSRHVDKHVEVETIVCEFGR